MEKDTRRVTGRCAEMHAGNDAGRNTRRCARRCAAEEEKNAMCDEFHEIHEFHLHEFLKFGFHGGFKFHERCEKYEICGEKCGKTAHLPHPSGPSEP